MRALIGGVLLLFLSETLSQKGNECLRLLLLEMNVHGEQKTSKSFFYDVTSRTNKLTKNVLLPLDA